MTDAAPGVPASQTLSRGIRVLETLADAREPLTIDEVAERLEVHRSVAYRLVRTLEQHGLIVRERSGRLTLGARMAALAAGVAHDLQAEALPELTAVANDLGMTCFLAVLDHEECVTLVSVEPRHSVAAVAQRPGTRHPVTVGAPGKAILAQLPERAWPRSLPAPVVADISEAAARGFATSHDEVLPSVHAVAVPLTLRSRPPATIAVVHVAGGTEPSIIAARLARSAEAIRDALGG
ncbi:DNA-binding IclR family transcriptional regulator [Microbacterium sp. AK009]|uniref:IclR family transcriptional regulator n=1 Tax=Microbacterium sp. AK009 TaxID=2723068 RepID=UPI0015C825E4|nr:helix-turn-helix domain-containing protein [Microbacterium sp. AK009]NYF15765.1 DNA-binding IclR family transcriptional regulator [Microbacterium sp. AK009]